MDKLTIATQVLLKLIETDKTGFDAEGIAAYSFEIADAMQAEAEKRKKVEAAQKRKEIREMLNAPNTFVEREGQHFDDVADIQKPYTSSEEWQPDWSQAPDDATAWEYLGHGSARWHTTTKGMYRAADLFGYSGTDMLSVERPDGF